MKRATAFLLLCGWGIAGLPACVPLPPPQPPEVPPPAVVVPTPPPEEQPPAPPVRPAPAPVPRYRERERRALDLLRRDELANALTAWKILQALDPDNPEYPRQVSATRALIRHRAQRHIALGDEALAAGDREKAQVEYLKALALDPWQRDPLAKLREIDRERALTAQEDRLAKVAARRSGSKKGGGEKANGAAPSQQERDYLETGVALFKQGEYEESVLEIEKYLQSFPDDAEARRYLEDAQRRLAAPAGPSTTPPARPSSKTPPAAPSPASPPAEESGKSAEAAGPTEKDRILAKEFYEKGLRASRANIAQAIEYWEQALRYDPSHVQAKIQLEQAWRMLRNLKQIPAD